MNFLKHFSTIIYCYLVLYLLAMVVQHELGDSLLKALTILLGIFYCFTYCSLGYITYYFNERKWLMVSFYGYAIITCILLIYQQFNSTISDLSSLLRIFATIALIISSFKIRNSFIKPYFKGFGFAAIIVIWLRIPDKLIDSSNQTSLMALQVIHLTPIILILIMLLKIIAAIELMDKQASN